MALHALQSARALGIRVHIDGNNLALEAREQPPQAVLDLLSHHKADILRLLRPANDGWSAEDWQVFFEERAAIAEFDGGLPRPQAERQAFGSPNRVDVPSAAVEIDLAIHWFRLGLRREGMSGFIARAGRHGAALERPRPSRYSRRWVFELERHLKARWKERHRVRLEV